MSFEYVSALRASFSVSTLSVLLVGALIMGCSTSHDGGAQSPLASTTRPLDPPPTYASTPPTADAIASLITKAFSESSSDAIAQGLPVAEYQTADRVVALLDVWTGPYGTPVHLSGTTIEVNDPRYPQVVLGYCEDVGDATRRLFGATHTPAFRQANQLMAQLHRARLGFLQQQRSIPDVGLDYWQQEEQLFYRLPL